MSTYNLANGLGDALSSTPVKVGPGHFFIAVSGVFASTVVTVKVNVGAATAAVLTNAVYTESACDIIWLPDCTIYVETAGGGGTTAVNVALSEVVTEVK